MSHRCEYCDTAHNQMPGWSHVVKPNGSHLWWCRVQEGMWTFAIGVRVVVDERGPLITWIARPERRGLTITEWLRRASLRELAASHQADEGATR